MDLLTILLPCNDEKPDYLRAALNSVFGQSVAGWKLLVVTEASTSDVLRELQERGDPRVRVRPNESYRLTGALNTAMRHADTPFVCALHSDDLLERDAIEVVERAITTHPDVDYFHSARIQIDDEGNPVSPVLPACQNVTLDDFRHRSPVKHLHAWRREAALAIGGMDENLGPHGADDYDFPWCMLEAGYRFQAIPECLYRKRDHRSHYRLTTHIPLDIQIGELRKIFRKHGMTESEIEEQIALRRAGYLKQALYLDGEDRRRKEDEGYDIRQGWRISYDS